MSEQDRNSLIVEALMSRTEALRKRHLLGDLLRRLGTRLKQIGEALSPYDGKSPEWATVEGNLSMTHLDTAWAEILDAEKIRALIAELIQAEQTIEEKSAALRAYGCE